MSVSAGRSTQAGTVRKVVGSESSHTYFGDIGDTECDHEGSAEEDNVSVCVLLLS